MPAYAGMSGFLLSHCKLDGVGIAYAFRGSSSRRPRTSAADVPAAQQKRSVELAVPNVELAWKLDDKFMERATAYTKLMYENKQIRQEIDLKQFVTTQFQ